MALKIWLNNSMKKIDTNLHKPVTFINGTKYKLDKAWIFVNGEKKQIWGETGIQIDYISSTGTIGGGSVFCIGENRAYLYRSNNIYVVDISNISVPTVAGTANWGDVRQYTSIQSVGDSMVFWASSNTTNYNKIKIIPSTGNIFIEETKVGAGKTLIGFTNDYVVQAEGIGTGGTPSLTYGSKIYFGTQNVYNVGSSSSPLNYNSGYYGQGVQDSASTVLANLSHVQYPSATNPTGLHSFSYGSQTRKGDLCYDLVMCDSNILVKNKKASTSQYVSPYATEFINKTNMSSVFTFTPSGDISRFIGKIGSYYYLLDINTNVSSKQVKLVMLDSSNFTTVFTKILPNDPFNEYSGDITFWKNCYIMPQISNTGFLGVSTYDSSTLGLRIARFSGLI